MKQSYFKMAAAGLVAVASVAPLSFSQAEGTAAPAADVAAQEAPATAEDAKKAFSYYAGFTFGQQVSQGISTLSIDDFDQEVFFKALADSLKGNGPTMKEEEIAAGMQAFVATIEAREKAVADENLAKGKAFQAEFAKQEGVTTTASGLMYRVITAGEGRTYDAAKDGEDAVALVTYEGRLIDGKVFDSADEPGVQMPITRVVDGFSEALKMMPIGSEWELCIPAELAYGNEGSGPIAANSTLIFKLKLKDITKPSAPAMQLPPEILEQLRAQGLDIPVEE